MRLISDCSSGQPISLLHHEGIPVLMEISNINQMPCEYFWQSIILILNHVCICICLEHIIWPFWIMCSDLATYLLDINRNVFAWLQRLQLEPRKMYPISPAFTSLTCLKLDCHTDNWLHSLQVYYRVKLTFLKLLMPYITDLLCFYSPTLPPPHPPGLTISCHDYGFNVMTLRVCILGCVLYGYWQWNCSNGLKLGLFLYY